MPGRIIYFLFVLSVVMTGSFCRQHLSAQPPGNSSTVTAAISQHSPLPTKGAIRSFSGSFIAPEQTSEVLLSVYHPVCKHLATPHWHPRPETITIHPSGSRVVNRHPDSVDYYVFSLKKILI